MSCQMINAEVAPCQSLKTWLDLSELLCFSDPNQILMFWFSFRPLRHHQNDEGTLFKCSL